MSTVHTHRRCNRIHFSSVDLYSNSFELLFGVSCAAKERRGKALWRIPSPPKNRWCGCRRLPTARHPESSSRKITTAGNKGMCAHLSMTYPGLYMHTSRFCLSAKTVWVDKGTQIISSRASHTMQAEKTNYAEKLGTWRWPSWAADARTSSGILLLLASLHAPAFLRYST